MVHVNGELEKETIRCQFVIIASLASSQKRQFGVSSSLLLPLHQVSKLDSWKDFQDRQTIRCQFVIIASLASSQ